MTKHIETIRKTRSVLLEQLTGLNSEQLNQIPQGCNNNIIWNLGHMIVVQQGVCYKRAGLPTLISDDFRERFRSGSKPEGVVSDDTIAYVKEELFNTLDQLEMDYSHQIFGHYTTWSSRQGTEITSIDDALAFLIFHEELHYFTIMTISKLVKSLPIEKRV